MSIESYIQMMRPAIEEDLKYSMEHWLPQEYTGLRSMISYHMGWEGQGAGPAAQGKRIRSLMVLLSASAAGAEWQKALPLASGVEYVHNFSLLHDDIQDNSRTRRGRQTVWVIWGVPQAINVGDTMYTLAYLCMSRVKDSVSPEASLLASQLLQEASIELTQGQHLDIDYENKNELPIDAYWPMITGKTAALLACCAEMGAVVAGADIKRRNAFREFGKSLGLAFQVVDDWLGIWGDPLSTGKPTGSDLISGKKSLPILFSLTQKKRFYDRWMDGSIASNEVERMAAWLEEEGAKDYTEKIADNLTKSAIQSLKEAVPEENDAYLALKELSTKLVQRNH